MDKPVLRYFPIVGRAQALRHALWEAEIAHDYLQVSPAQWAAGRGDPSFGGPFAGLPTLTWDGETIGETVAIAAFLGRRLGHYSGRSDQQIARIEAIVSHCHLEVLHKLGELLWADVLYPGVDVANTFARHFARMMEKLGLLDGLAAETALAGSGGWLVAGPAAEAEAQPSLADFFAAEALEAVRYVLGTERAPALQMRLPRLTALADRIRTRPRLAEAFATRPDRFSTNRDEEDLLDRLRGL